MASQPGSARTPLESVFSYIPSGHEKVAKQTLFNVAGFAFVLVFSSVGFATYNVFQPFVKPLLWALLLGTVMHPAKRRLTVAARGWLARMQLSSTPLFVHALLAPVRAFDAGTDAIANAAVRHIHTLAAFVVTIALVNVAWFYTPSVLVGLFWLVSHGLIANLLWLLTRIFYNRLLCWTLLVGYAVAVVFCWGPTTRRFAVPSWLLLLGFLSGLAGPLAGPIFVALVALMVVGFVTEVLTRMRQRDSEGINVSMSRTIEAIMHDQSTVVYQSPSQADAAPAATPAATPSAPTAPSATSADPSPKSSDPLTSSADPSATSADPSATPTASSTTPTDPRASARSTAYLAQKGMTSTPLTRTRPISLQERAGATGSAVETVRHEEGEIDPSNQQQAEEPSGGGTINSQTSTYITTVAYCCLVVIIWQRIWLISMLPIVVVYYFSKRLVVNFWQSGGRDSMSASVQPARDWLAQRQEGIMPMPVRGVWKLVLRGNAHVISKVLDSVDAAVTIVVVLGALVFVSFATIFAFVQIYGETLHMVELAANVINSTVVANPDLQSLLPANISQMVEQMMDNGYLYGRDYISVMVRDLTKGASSSTQQEQLERQTLELWERMYQAWLSSVVAVPPVGPVVDADGVASAWQLWLEKVQNSSDLFAMDTLKEAVKSNLSTIMSVLESSWVIVRGNLTMLASVVTTLISLLLGGGFAVLNSLLNLIVFVTALFYLLSASGQIYKPVELITKLGPVSRGSSRFIMAVDEAVGSVFVASFKMAVFYFMWTWLVHSVFAVKFVYLPSVVAAMLGAVPFLGSYWAAVPAVLELWLVHDQPITALLLFAAQLAPIMFVDTAIYSEIKWGHPYLTGLAIAGGIFCQGIEGAIFGPVLLCCLLVAVNVYSSLVNTPDDDRKMFTGRLKRMGTIW